MKSLEIANKASESEQRIALESYRLLTSITERVNSDEVEIEILDNKIKIPQMALELLIHVLKAMSQNKQVSIATTVSEVSTQKAAEMIGCSRPYLVKLLENGEIDFTKIGKHRRIKVEDIEKYKQIIKANRRQVITDIMKSDEELGLYEL